MHHYTKSSKRNKCWSPSAIHAFLLCALSCEEERILAFPIQKWIPYYWGCFSQCAISGDSVHYSFSVIWTLSDRRSNWESRYSLSDSLNLCMLASDDTGSSSPCCTGIAGFLVFCGFFVVLHCVYGRSYPQKQRNILGARWEQGYGKGRLKQGR